ncbi:30S ribosomal protein S5 [candidate division WOR-1 bacterium RIFOXYB2_FULL_42_35]|uniref:Small ribosomal subunit protein uS5 n=1 Tax=candidate division WOR-1 bacterium RIFOXYC2_FULL_41_25 TaxID=1802586 RepID=A0A1F4TM00_UNCSA|nr:MAG: 30S ribosomal protein S5 [candidate division WOR-1 bacterium RIFOXYA2_FULL_41_14]OGC23870.1 MAG: 30S ribosomal protein S5 [candidate division WOR-1 bacterium RIFOXYB2_FULL_42_35]OGC33745.1 MAG: 30S ribosomal protein S5 [candidate division WOR-1 bacterium RIFOXYC2_FULL_41_25]OGC42501.1 MAG: 30S ribosomal protein S5 [candidate division WOR-1 bacterium RIFOXYD2_FULL_41_8]
MSEERDRNSELKEKVVQIRRVTKVVKGGKKMGFRAVVVVGDLAGSVGLGIGKAIEVASAIRKGVEAGKRQQVSITQVGGTIPHDVIGRFGASKVVLRPAPLGTGVIAGGAVRTILELCGLKNVVAKSIGSNNAINVARATLNGLVALKDLEEQKILRGKDIKVKYVGIKES